MSTTRRDFGLKNYPLAMFFGSHPAMLLTSTNAFLHISALVTFFAFCLANAFPNFPF
ncbi:hypothetical protein HanOQP8_Chr04g0129081 [Helianthus annuus]|nr:hypothetical protein HanHA89_Chr04g0128591 [Helianthus annuus]KAJ0759652.1 hypothetical protein HanOQP8_Chr04g0129081 [Helianthus annuus]KAJ0823850.1 hypothetical protein HanLR1_Chr00c0168g0724521 [Helianthus annuus]